MGKNYVSALPRGWVICDANRPPFVGFSVKTPQGYMATAYSHGRNPENILYLLLKELYAQQQAGVDTGNIA